MKSAELDRALILEQAASVQKELADTSQRAKGLADYRGDLMLMAYEAGIPVADIAAALEITQPRVYQIMHQAKKRQTREMV